MWYARAHRHTSARSIGFCVIWFVLGLVRVQRGKLDRFKGMRALTPGVREKQFHQDISELTSFLRPEREEDCYQILFYVRPPRSLFA